MTQRTDSPRTFTEAIGKVHRRTGGGEAVIFLKIIKENFLTLKESLSL